MTDIPVESLEGAMLDMAVAVAEGWAFGKPQQKQCHGKRWLLYPVARPGQATLGAAGLENGVWDGVPRYSADPNVGHPIIDRTMRRAHRLASGNWCVEAGAGYHCWRAYGPTLLIAGLRAHVGSCRSVAAAEAARAPAASKLGPTIPAALLGLEDSK